MTWVVWNLVLVRLETVLASVQDRCTVCTERINGMEVILGIPDGTLGELSQVEARFTPFGDSVNIGARYVYGLRQMHHRLRNHFGCTRWYSDITWVKWGLVSVHLEIVLISTQDSCTVCGERTIGS